MLGSLCAIEVLSAVISPMLVITVKSLSKSPDASVISFGTFAILSQALTSAAIAATKSPMPNPNDIVEIYWHNHSLEAIEVRM